MKKAIIDVGSNSVRLMMWADGITLYKRLNTTRLGEGIAKSPRLKAEAIERTARAVAEFARVADEEGAACTVFATAAVRSAENGAAFCGRVKELCGLMVDVVSGESEALLGLCGAVGNADGGIIDVGGASSEVCIRTGGKITASVSLDIGAVRLFDMCGEDRQALERAIAEKIAPLQAHHTENRVYGIGGTATTVAAVKLAVKQYDANLIQDYRLTVEDLNCFADRMFSLSVSQRRQLDGMDEKRAEIIAGGALLLTRIAERLALKEIFVSDKDNLEGYLALRGIV